MTRPVDALLVLADGTVFEGEAMGAVVEVATGEVVFNTVLAGYQEVITDPSYAGQVIAFTYPHIGNYGISAADSESARPFCRGVVVRELARRPSNWRSTVDLDTWLAASGVPGIAGVDTRRLTRHIRDAGSMPCAFGTADESTLKAAARAEQGTEGIDLVAQVTTAAPYAIGSDAGTGRRIVAVDYGIKRTILRQLAGLGAVEVVPAHAGAADILARAPHGVFLSNGPGDPAAIPYAVDTIRGLLGEVPVFGICLGHQLLARALGAETVKLPFGHHGGNHPVRDLSTGHVEITSQNHNFAVAADTLPAGVEQSHVNLNDGVCEGITAPGLRAFSVQYHPEAGPGPHDSRYLFARFAELMGGPLLARRDEGVEAPAGLPEPEWGVAG